MDLGEMPQKKDQVLLRRCFLGCHGSAYFLKMQAMLAHWEGEQGHIFCIKKVKAMIFSNHSDITLPSLHISNIKSDY